MKAIELFCCAGGMAEGFRRAGIGFVPAFDFDPDACDSYEHNLGHRPIQMDVRDLLRLWRLLDLDAQIDLLVADPPCTPWSRAGKRRGLDDEADMLRETCALIDLVRPKCWLIGNVPGLDDSTNTGAVAQTIGRLSGDYDVDYARLNASSYGVPQHRVRPFWFGRPRGSAPLRWPEPTHGDPAAPRLPGCELLPWVTCREALQHLPTEHLGRPVRVRRKPDEVGDLLAHTNRGGHPMSHVDYPAQTITTREKGARGGGVLLLSERHPISRPDGPSYVITSRGNRGAQEGGVIAWPWDRPATTVTADERIAPPGHHGTSFLSEANAIVLSEKARAILQGFPEHWHFAGKTKASRGAQIGMAMPPPLAHAVAESIVVWFEAQEARAVA